MNGKLKNNKNHELSLKLSKEELIRVIANMHDTIQEWNSGWGLPEEQADALIKIGSSCTAYCVKKGNWDLPKINSSDTKSKN